MTTTSLFTLIALALTSVCVFLLLRPLLKTSITPSVKRSDSLVAAYRKKLAILEQQRSNRELDKEQYRQARQELEYAFAEELPEQEIDLQSTTSNTKVLCAISITVPVIAIVSYLMWGTPAALLPQTAASAHSQQDLPGMDVLVKSLEEKVAANPENADGWLLLGRSYMSLNQPDKAREVFERAIKLAPENVDFLVYYAEILANLQGNALAGKPEEMLDRALSIDSDMARAKALKGIALFQQNMSKEALAIWKPMYADPTIEPEMHELLAQLISAAAPSEQMTAVENKVAITPKKTEKVANKKDAVVTAQIEVNVALDDNFRDQVSPQDTLFIYARAISGPPMPLAIKRLRADALPLTITLSDSDSMMADMKVSNFDQVIVNARISKRGSATPVSGDIQGMSDTLNPKHNPKINIVINQVVP